MAFVLEEQGYEDFNINGQMLRVDVMEVMHQMMMIYETNKDDQVKQHDEWKQYLTALGFPPDISFHSCERVFYHVLSAMETLRKKFPNPSSEQPK